MNYVLLGNIAAGKSTLLQQTTCKKIVMGQLLRNEKSKKNVSELINKGILVEDSVVDILFAKYIEPNNCIIDGYPRSIGQLEYLLGTGYEYKFFLINSDKCNVIKRIQSRLICSSCGLLKTNFICVCGSYDFERRKDDVDMTIIEDRYRMQEIKLNEILTELKRRNIPIVTVENNGTLDEAYAEFKKHIA